VDKTWREGEGALKEESWLLDSRIDWVLWWYPLTLYASAS
jgi:hypothetical protein